MVRLRIPSGVTSIEQLKLVRDYVKKYNLEKIHLTTRQAIQLHGMNIDDICDLMRDGLDVNLFTRGSGGNFPRNVALSPLSGVDVNEAFDPTDYALAVGNNFMRKINTYKLPRKLKVSFSNSNEDTAHCTVQDLGFLAVKKDNENYFKVYLAGGLGNNPRKAIEYDELIKPSEVIYYVEAMTNLFIAEGDYKNRAKARIRYIADRMGDELFIKTFKEYVNNEKNNKDNEINIYPTECKKEGKVTEITDKRLFKQKQEGLYSVEVHPVGGQLSIGDLEKVINILEDYKDIEIILAMEEGFYIRNLNGEEAEKVLEITKEFSACNDLERSVACIGVPTCQIGIGNSQKLLFDIVEYFRENNYNTDLLPSIFISGCPNSCGVHEIGKIGFVGKKKKVDDKVCDVFGLFLGGNVGVGSTALGEWQCDMLPEKIPTFLFELSEELKNAEVSIDDLLSNESEIKSIINKYKV